MGLRQRNHLRRLRTRQLMKRVKLTTTVLFVMVNVTCLLPLRLDGPMDSNQKPKPSSQSHQVMTRVSTATGSRNNLSRQTVPVVTNFHHQQSRSTHLRESR